MGARLGRFIGKLHGSTHGVADFAQQIDNRGIQQVRFDMQYCAMEKLLESIGCDDWAVLGRRSFELGEKYLSPGKCVIMGDLWPRSILADASRYSIRIIDWEFAHFGRPAQDIAHLAAHCWMMAHRASSELDKTSILSLWAAFIDSYRETLGAEWTALWDAGEHRDASVHFGCEIVMRTMGPFQNGYLYEDLEARSPAIREAVKCAVRHIRKPDSVF